MWTQDQIDAARNFEGTSESIGSIADRIKISEIEAEDLMLSANLEQCSECGWWCEWSELLDDTEEPAPCSGCRGYA